MDKHIFILNTISASQILTKSNDTLTTTRDIHSVDTTDVAKNINFLK